ncbi:hypothetical protein [Desulfovibrio subterraneus]|uniref:hypothetical protein n=1 Tax=Desulfovibrio subterraneus TaxID=2718620 RepID=UPI00157B6788|nr:hypothetical protein [Desulfovibrio subterraneus]
MPTTGVVTWGVTSAAGASAFGWVFIVLDFFIMKLSLLKIYINCPRHIPMSSGIELAVRSEVPDVMRNAEVTRGRHGLNVSYRILTQRATVSHWNDIEKDGNLSPADFVVLSLALR